MHYNAFSDRHPQTSVASILHFYDTVLRLALISCHFLSTDLWPTSDPHHRKLPLTFTFTKAYAGYNNVQQCVKCQ